MSARVMSNCPSVTLGAPLVVFTIDLLFKQRFTINSASRGFILTRSIELRILPFTFSVVFSILVVIPVVITIAVVVVIAVAVAVVVVIAVAVAVAVDVAVAVVSTRVTAI